MRFLAHRYAAVELIHTDGAAGIDGCGSHGAFQWNPHGNGCKHAAVKRRHASGERAVREHGAVTRNKNSKTAKLVTPIGFSCRFHAVADENDAFFPKKPEGSPDCAGGDVYAVADKLDEAGGCIEGGADNAG